MSTKVVRNDHVLKQKCSIITSFPIEGDPLGSPCQKTMTVIGDQNYDV